MEDVLNGKRGKLSYLVQLALVVVGLAALIWLLTTAAHFLVPAVCALVVGIVFAPLSDRFDRLGAPPIVAALVVVLIVLAVAAAAVVLFYPVVAEFLRRVPLLWFEVQGVLRTVQSTMENVADVQQKVADALAAGGTSTAQTEEGVKLPGAQDVIAHLPRIAAQLLIFVGILYFFLLTRFDVYNAVDRNTRHLSAKVLCRAETEVSRYFLTITAINAAFGVLVTLVMSAIGMPNAAYWGVGAFLVNFVLYLGPIFFAMTLVVAGIIVFDGAMSFLPAALYLSMNMTEGQFLTPSLVGRHMSVNPLLIFVSLVFWMWLWGPLGGVIAIPMLVWLRQINKALAQDEPAESVKTPAVPASGEGADAHRSEVDYGPAQ